MWMRNSSSINGVKKLKEVPAYAMKACAGVRGIAALILNNIRCNLNASLHMLDVDFVRRGR
jgi:hypothetical protein